MQKGMSYYLIDDKIRLMEDDFWLESQFSVKKSQKNLLEGINILVVDDNPINLTVADKTLAKFSGTSFKCLNAEDALQIFNSNNIHLILMDLHMPNIDGFEAAKMIKQTEKFLNKPICILAYTTYSYNDIKVDLELAGFDGYIGKPFTHTQVIDTIIDAVAKVK